MSGDLGLPALLLQLLPASSLSLQPTMILRYMAAFSSGAEPVRSAVLCVAATTPLILRAGGPKSIVMGTEPVPVRPQ